MQTSLIAEFWLDQAAAALKAWAILTPLILVAVVFKLKSMTAPQAEKKARELKAYTEVVESRLQLARELNSEESKSLTTLRAEIDALRQLVETRFRSRTRNKPRAVETALNQAEASAATLATANSRTDHILTAEKLAIGDLEKDQNLTLVRPTD